MPQESALSAIEENLSSGLEFNIWDIIYKQQNIKVVYLHLIGKCLRNGPPVEL